MAIWKCTNCNEAYIAPEGSKTANQVPSKCYNCNSEVKKE